MKRPGRKIPVDRYPSPSCPERNRIQIPTRNTIHMRRLQIHRLCPPEGDRGRTTGRSRSGDRWRTARSAWCGSSTRTCCVCKAWRAAIDGGRLLRAELLPRSLGGIFVDFNMLGRTEFFSSPSCGSGGAAATVSGDLDYAPDTSVEGHCNGLVLLFSCVANPTTRQWAHLPEQPPPRTATEDAYYELPYLVFDPTLSPLRGVLDPRCPVLGRPGPRGAGVGMATAIVGDTRLLVKNWALGGEVVRSGRRSRRNHG